MPVNDYSIVVQSVAENPLVHKDIRYPAMNLLAEFLRRDFVRIIIEWAHAEVISSVDDMTFLAKTIVDLDMRCVIFPWLEYLSVKRSDSASTTISYTLYF